MNSSSIKEKAKKVKEFDEIDNFLHTVISIAGLKAFLIVNVSEGYFSPNGLTIVFSYGISDDYINLCKHNSASLSEFLKCLESKINSELRISPERRWIYEEPVDANRRVGILAMDFSTDFSNLHKLAVLNMVRLITKTLTLKKLSVKQELFESFLEFLMLIISTWNLNITLDKMVQLAARMVSQSFSFSYVFIKFKTAFDSYTAEEGELDSQYKAIKFVELNTSGVLRGSINEHTWLVGVEKGVEADTRVIFLTDRGISDHDTEIFKVMVNMLHMTLMIGINRLKEQAALHKLKRRFQDTLSMLKEMVDVRDPYTESHSERVSSFAYQIGKLLGFDKNRLEKLRIAGFLHDIGKIGIPEAILFKPIRLTPKERRIIKKHSELGAQILEQYGEFWEIVPWVRYHHENWDGTGYPEGLMAHEIPLEARILALADALEAMSSDRVYRKALDVKKIREILLNGAGKQWDPYITRILVKNLEQILSSIPYAKLPSVYNSVRQRRLEAAYSWIHYQIMRHIGKTMDSNSSPYNRFIEILNAIRVELDYRAIYIFKVSDFKLNEWIRIGDKEIFPMIDFEFSIKTSPCNELKNYISKMLQQKLYYEVINVKITSKSSAIIFVARDYNEISSFEVPIVKFPIKSLLMAYGDEF